MNSVHEQWSKQYTESKTGLGAPGTHPEPKLHAHCVCTAPRPCAGPCRGAHRCRVVSIPRSCCRSPLMCHGRAQPCRKPGWPCRALYRCTPRVCRCVPSYLRSRYNILYRNIVPQPSRASARCRSCRAFLSTVLHALPGHIVGMAGRVVA